MKPRSISVWLDRSLLRYAAMALLSSPACLQAQVPEGPAGAPAVTDLGGLVRAAVVASPRVQGAAAQHEEAAIHARAARTGYYPTPSIEFGQSTRGNRQGVLQLDQPLWAGGAIDASVRAADARSRAGEASEDSAREAVGLDTLGAWRDYALAHARERALERMAAEYQRLFAQIQRRVASGASAASDLAYVQARAEQIEAQLAEVRGAKVAAHGALAVLLAAPLTPEALAALAGELDKPVRRVLWDPAVAADAVLGRSPRVEQLRAEAQAARHDQETRRAEAWPRVSVSLQKGFGADSNLNGDKLRVMLNVRFAPGAGWSQLARTEAAAQRTADAEARIRETSNQLRVELRQLIAQLHAEAMQRPSLERQHMADAEVYDSYQRLFEAGRRSWIDVLNSLRDKNNTELQQAANAVAIRYLDARLQLLTTGSVASQEAAQ
ncbi:MAG: TolC family protein [Candidatus Dactylopiibacterium sp.]|nr:TolC family protein [Candidatus Dactylopiibacterium sp.]